ncbi:hypothetical protein C1N77_05395 [Geobacillus thermoleovorans]|nr:hypothetical protein B1692_10080 [Geobacillus thermoleovorans]
MDWSKATVQQLVTIIRFEECPEIYKHRAWQEMKQRLGGRDHEKTTSITAWTSENQLSHAGRTGSVPKPSAQILR